MTAERIGLAIRSDAVSAIGLRGENIVWAVSAPLESSEVLESAAFDLLRQAPRGRWLQPRVVAAIGPTSCQTRRLTGLPPLENATVASSLVQENVARFFLRTGVPLIAGAAVRAADGAWWSAAYEEPTVTAIRNACRRSRTKLMAVVPTIAILCMSFDGDVIVWRDGAMAIRAEFGGNHLAECHRVPMDDGPEPPVREGLFPAGVDAREYVDSFAAGSTPDLRHVPALIPDDVLASTLPRWRIAAATSALAIATATFIVAPGAGAHLAAERADGSAARLEVQARQALAYEADLGRLRSSLSEIDALTATMRHPASSVLSLLTQAMPDSAAIVSVRFDSTGGQVVVLATRAATVLARLEETRLITNPLIVGPITRERTDGRERERVTIKFERR